MHFLELNIDSCKIIVKETRFIEFITLCIYIYVVLAYGIDVKQCFVFWIYQKFGLVKGGLHQTIKCTHFAFFFCRYGCTVSCILDQNVESHDYASIAWWRRWKKKKRLTFKRNASCDLNQLLECLSSALWWNWCSFID